MKLLIIICIIVVLYCLFPLIRVIGDSMYPTYLDNEVIIGSRLFLKSRLKEGDVIVYKSPVDDRIVIKRIHHLMYDKKKIYLYYLGDNADYSYDSRMYGYVSSESIVCKVINQRRKIEV